MATTTTNYGFDVPTSSDLVKNGATQIALLGQDLDTFLFRPFTRNAIINGAFDIWQRGTSFTATTSTSAYGADRWNIYNNRTGTTYSRQTSGLTGFQYSMRVQRDSGNTATGELYLAQFLESADSFRFAGQQVTLSFWAKAGANYSSAGNALTAQIRTGTGTDQNIWTGYTGTATIGNLSATLTTSWQRFSVTASAGSTATELAILFATTPTGTAGANDWFEVTGVQLEQGSQASPFIRAGGTIQGELAACQRYYYRTSGSNAYYLIGSGYATSTTAAAGIISFPVTMRTTPTSFANGSLYVEDSGAAGSVTSTATYGNASTNTVKINLTSLTGAAPTAHRPVLIYTNNSSSSFVSAEAEL